MRKLGLVLGYECNNHCVFCYDGAGYKRGVYPPISTEEAKKMLERGREAGCDTVDILGGEPTIRKDLKELIAYAKDLGYIHVSITTNGRMLSYMDYLRELVDAGLNAIIFSIHGPSAEVHDAATSVPGSFEQVMRAVDNVLALRNEGHTIFLADNTVMIKQNMVYLADTLRLLWSKEFESITFLFPHPKGNAEHYFYRVVPRLTELEPHIWATVEALDELMRTQPRRVQFKFRYLPLCYLYPRTELSDELMGRKMGYEEKHVGPEFEDWQVEKGRVEVGKVKAPKCERCALNDECEGVWVEYADNYGTSELRPITP